MIAHQFESLPQAERFQILVNSCAVPEDVVKRQGRAMTITIYHNPNCGTSRTVLAALRDGGHEPQVIEYLKQPPSRDTMKSLLAAMNMGPRDILRRKGTPFEELGLENPALTDDQLLDALAAHPILMERPVVQTPLGVRVCRPADRLQEILPI
jgi:arsenate reductase